MKLLKYIKGLRKGQDAHRLELKAMKDPFLQDALEGFDNIQGDHSKAIKQLSKQVNKRTYHSKHKQAITRSIAASLLIGICISSYFIFHENEITESSVALKTSGEGVNILPHKLEEEKKQEQIAHIPETQKEVLAPPPPPVLNIVEDDMMMHDISEGSFEEVMSIAEESCEKEEHSTEYIMPPASNLKKDIDISKSIAMTENSEELNEVVAIISEVNTNRDITPKPIIGEKEFKKYLEKNLRRPTDDLCKKKKGKVILAFYIDNTGRPMNITVKQGLCDSADIEAVRLINDGPDWSSGEKEVTVTVKF